MKKIEIFYYTGFFDGGWVQEIWEGYAAGDLTALKREKKECDMFRKYASAIVFDQPSRSGLDLLVYNFVGAKRKEVEPIKFSKYEKKFNIGYKSLGYATGDLEKAKEHFQKHTTLPLFWAPMTIEYFEAEK